LNWGGVREGGDGIEKSCAFCCADVFGVRALWPFVPGGGA
jgi:hypothetical protein